MSVSGGGLKAQHVLPFILSFPAVAGRIEELLEKWPPRQAQQAQQQPPGPQAQAAEERTPPPPPAAGGALPSGVQLPPMPSPFESSIGGRAAPAWQRGTRQSTTSELSSLPLSSETDEISFMEEETDGADSSRRHTTDESGEAAATQQPPVVQHPAAAQQQQGDGLAEPGAGDVLRFVRAQRCLHHLHLPVRLLQPAEHTCPRPARNNGA